MFFLGGGDGLGPRSGLASLQGNHKTGSSSRIHKKRERERERRVQERNKLKERTK